jgi:hypothetical protein
MRRVARGGDPVLVETFSGSRRDERPMAILWGLQRLEVLEVLSEQLREPVDKPLERKRSFLVRTSCRLVLRLEHTLQTDRWRVTAVLEELEGGRAAR